MMAIRFLYLDGDYTGKYNVFMRDSVLIKILGVKIIQSIYVVV
jgi:hypothetical protein